MSQLLVQNQINLNENISGLVQISQGEDGKLSVIATVFENEKPIRKAEHKFEDGTRAFEWAFNLSSAFDTRQDRSIALAFQAFPAKFVDL